MTARHPLQYADDMDAAPPQVFSFGRPTVRRYDAAESQRIESLLENPDAFASWVSEQCIGHRKVHAGYVPRDSVALDAVIASADVPKLVVLLLYPRSDVSYAAQHELRSRFVDAYTERVRP